MNFRIILTPLLLSAMMDWTTTTAIPLRKNIPFVERQQTFALNVAKLILYINVKGYKCTFGETYRTTEMAQIYAKTSNLKWIRYDRQQPNDMFIISFYGISNL